MSEPRSFESRAVHAGQAMNPTRALSMPVFQTATFRFDSCEQGAELCRSVAPSELYTRWGNPTTRALEHALADLEGGAAALAFASGMGAGSAAVLATVKSGDHVVAANCLYTGMTELFENVLRGFGVQTTFVDPGDVQNIDRAIRDDTTLVYVETPANPTLAITDLAAVAEICRRRGVFSIADNTWASPYNTRPIELGIDGVVHSATKYLAGHSDVVSGAVVGEGAWIEKVWKMLKIFGACPGPHDSWLVLRGLQTLALRVERHNASALRIARHLADHRRIAAVHYPGLENHPGHAVAARQMHGFGGMLAFEVEGDVNAGRRVIESLELITPAVSLGGTETLAVHAASTTHAPLTDEQRRRAGIAPGLIRCSVGLESPDDLIADLDRALEVA